MSKDDDQMSEADDQTLAEEYREHEGWVGAYATEKKIERLESANNELLEALEGMLELRPDDCSSQIYKIRQKAEKAIQKARGQG